MEEYNAPKSHRMERLPRNKSGVQDAKWLQRRFRRDAAIVQRMSESLDVGDSKSAPFYTTFFPDDMSKTIGKLGVNPAKPIHEDRRAKRARISKLRREERSHKMQIREINPNEDFADKDDYDIVIHKRAQQQQQAIIDAWNKHLSLLKRETEERTMMETAIKALIEQGPSLAIERGVGRNWCEVV
jgi:hypothetical protein